MKVSQVAILLTKSKMTKKVQSAFFCQNCGTQSPKWLGKCPSCNEWNTYVEEVIKKNEKTKNWNGKSSKTNI